MPNVATIEDPAGKSKWNEIFKPIKLPMKLTITAMITTALFERASIMAHTDGIIKYENTGITPQILTAKTMDKPIEI